MLAIEDPITTPTGGTPPAAPDAAPQRMRSLARAARHDILRRLAPPLRHDMVVHLQSLGMMAEALTARLERGTIEQDDLQASVSKLNRLSRQAVGTCLQVSSWMQPADDDAVQLREGVEECVRLLSTSLNFRGFDLRTELGEGDFEVSRSSMRFLLAAAVLTLTDTATAPGEITIHTEFSSTHGVVAVDYAPQPEGSFTLLHESGEAPLAWAEVQALAAEESVELLRNGNAIILRLPRAVITSPLKMVPV
ncbi:hypothetical protein HK414_11575 [Ramlibacter terrae]|uniref:HAMP domain-containing histidine kinase n=1 Tax=Ramlibacter terrae TaxID=2732511 RepID=A0ABX6P2G4_9BURK|nr:hypothetical protein HK414_11575 [Ramlibacter terrae]